MSGCFFEAALLRIMTDGWMMGNVTPPDPDEVVNSAHPPSDDEQGPGYCACCHEFHLLTRVEIPALHWYADVCEFCAALGDAELAWRLGGLTEDGRFGYELPPDPLYARRRRRGQNQRFAKSLIVGESREGKAAGFGPARLTPLRRLRVGWRRLRGWRD
jgi:hypothetical protein